MRFHSQKLTSPHRRKVRIPDAARSLPPSQSLQLDRVSGQACAHLGQSCSIRATNHARRWPPGPKFRRARLPPLLHDVSHRRILCEVVSHTDCASTLPAMAGKPSISGVPIWRVFHCQQCTQHMPPMVLIHWQLHANTALCSCVASAALCVSPLFLPFGSSFKCSKRGKTRPMRPKSRNFLWRCAAGKKDLAGLSAERKKGHFSVKKCDLGSW